MPLNNFDASIVGRSSNCASKSAVGKAAYNARENLKDERTGESFNYETKGGLWQEAIFLPAGAPDWMLDRQQLYMAVERREDSGTSPANAQLLHSWIVALPHELTPEQNWAWLSKHGAEIAEKQGRIVDVCMHEPDADGDERNWHGHILVTMRRIDGSNEFGFGDKFRAPGNRSENNFREWARKELAGWKDRYSELGAEALREAGHTVEAEQFRHGHKTLREQERLAMERGDLEHAKYLRGREPQEHMGPEASAMEREGKRTRKGDRNAEREMRNSTRLESNGFRRADLQDHLKLGIGEHFGPKHTPWEKARDDIRDALRKPNAVEFRKELEDQGYVVCRASKEEVAISEKRHNQGKAIGKYAPKYKEGEVLVMDENQRIYRLSQKMTAKGWKEVNEFVKPLEKLDVPTISKASQEMHKRAQEFEREQQFRAALINPLPLQEKARESRSSRGMSLPSIGGINRKAERLAGKTLGAVAAARVLVGGPVKVAESLFSPLRTPEERAYDEAVNGIKRKQEERENARDR